MQLRSTETHELPQRTYTHGLAWQCHWNFNNIMNFVSNAWWWLSDNKRSQIASSSKAIIRILPIKWLTTSRKLPIAAANSGAHMWFKVVPQPWIYVIFLLAGNTESMWIQCGRVTLPLSTSPPSTLPFALEFAMLLLDKRDSNSRLSSIMTMVGVGVGFGPIGSSAIMPGSKGHRHICWVGHEGWRDLYLSTSRPKSPSSSHHTSSKLFIKSHWAINMCWWDSVLFFGHFV